MERNLGVADLHDAVLGRSAANMDHSALNLLIDFNLLNHTLKGNINKSDSRK